MGMKAVKHYVRILLQHADHFRQYILLMDGYAEFAVIMRCYNIFMCMRLNTWIDPNQHMKFMIIALDGLIEIFRFHHIINNERSDSGLQSFFDFPW